MYANLPQQMQSVACTYLYLATQHIHPDSIYYQEETAIDSTAYGISSRPLDQGIPYYLLPTGIDEREILVPSKNVQPNVICPSLTLLLIISQTQSTLQNYTGKLVTWSSCVCSCTVQYDTKILYLCLHCFLDFFI